MQHCKMILLLRWNSLSLNKIMIFFFLGTNGDESPPDATAVIKDSWDKRKPSEAYSFHFPETVAVCSVSSRCRCTQQIPPHCLHSYHQSWGLWSAVTLVGIMRGVFFWSRKAIPKITHTQRVCWWLRCSSFVQSIFRHDITHCLPSITVSKQSAGFYRHL